jgi:hypothetical protein
MNGSKAMRSGYSDDLDYTDLILYRGRVANATRGKRGQRLLRELLAALDAMPEKRLIRGKFVAPDGVCLLGAGAQRIGVTITDIPDIDPDEDDDTEHHSILAERFDVAKCLIAEIEFVNDEAGHYRETPEQRYERARKWLVENIKTPAASGEQEPRDCRIAER